MANPVALFSSVSFPFGVKSTVELISVCSVYIPFYLRFILSHLYPNYIPFLGSLYPIYILLYHHYTTIFDGLNPIEKYVPWSPLKQRWAPEPYCSWSWARWALVFGHGQTMASAKKTMGFGHRQFGDYPLVICHIAIENDHRSSGFSHWTWWCSIVFC